ncbi:glycosyltransferase [Cohaesibacter celericrescens]|uniref:Glycosyltransferase 2-like domain-containing protein n=1 Tax=Cohaesibacter celericrescens TaxID=2067669 RepID=A0A2N5XS37_9HYPH|nr:glycosyltransferase [Cohaesibacter celericrescens]PLW77257.1 hypothetical protein C0081_10555 [Cohaesibacter celericrescens]
MIKQISLLLPTRGRRTLVYRFLNSVLETAAEPSKIEVIICSDDDDDDSRDIKFPSLNLIQVVVPRQNMGAYNAICLERASGEISIAVNDDMIFRTKGWDDIVREIDGRFPDGIYLAYGNDLFKGRKLCTFPIMSRKMTDLMLEVYPRAYKGAFIDVHLMDIFKRLEKKGIQRFIYIENIVMEHVHYRVNTSVLDKTYTERARFDDDYTFAELISLREAEAERLVYAIKFPERPLHPHSFSPVSLHRRGIFFPIRAYVRLFLLDANLPLSWRCYLCVWMILRFYYAGFKKA